LSRRRDPPARDFHGCSSRVSAPEVDSGLEALASSSLVQAQSLGLPEDHR
jgi:hypothetical protein